MIFTKYCLTLQVGNKNYILNTYNSSLIEIDDHVKSKINKNQNMDCEFNEEEKSLLVSEGFLVNKEKDYERELEVREQYHSSKYVTSDRLKIDIGITNKCNFSCPYCFEKETRKNDVGNLDEQSFTELFAGLQEYVIDRIVHGVKTLDVVWYGGEPTLELEYLVFVNRKFIELTNKYGVSYNNTIITNGYKLRKSDILILSKQNLKYVQITIDGDKETHNKRRNISPTEDSFEKIMFNIELLLDAGIEVVVRINLDNENYTEVKSLLIYLSGRFRDKAGTYFFVDLARVFGSANSLDQFTFEAIYHELYLQAATLNLVCTSFDVLNTGVFCGAEARTGDLVIDFKGNVYKCWNDIFDEDCRIGNICRAKDTLDTFSQELYYTEELSLDYINNGKCLSCEYYKYCKGLCPHNRKRILVGTEENIYKNDACKEIVRKRICTYVEGYLIQNHENI